MALKFEWRGNSEFYSNPLHYVHVVVLLQCVPWTATQREGVASSALRRVSGSSCLTPPAPVVATLHSLTAALPPPHWHALVREGRGGRGGGCWCEGREGRGERAALVKEGRGEGEGGGVLVGGGGSAVVLVSSFSSFTLLN